MLEFRITAAPMAASTGKLQLQWSMRGVGYSGRAGSTLPCLVELGGLLTEDVVHVHDRSAWQPRAGA